MRTRFTNSHGILEFSEIKKKKGKEGKLKNNIPIEETDCSTVNVFDNGYVSVLLVI